MKSGILITTALAFALAACGNHDDQAAPSDGTTDIAIETSAAPTADEPQAFVDKMAGSDMFEMEAAKVAEKMGKSQKVKDFAGMMIADHTASSEKLKVAAASSQPALTVAPTLTAEQKNNLDSLRAAGDGFDKVYAEQQVSAHEAAIAALQSQAKDGTVPALNDFAKATAMVVEHHLGTARDLP